MKDLLEVEKKLTNEEWFKKSMSAYARRHDRRKELGLDVQQVN
jgi:hypothetical protein